jgi:tubulin--tyrosine ligase-like protein 12
LYPFNITSHITNLFATKFLVQWLEIHESTRSMIRSVFESASAVHSEMQNPFSRAMYGADVMLDNRFSFMVPPAILLYLNEN